MVKMMIFLRRGAGLDRAGFARWWLKDHRPLAEALPGLRRHTLNLLAEGGPYDAIVEQWFDTEEAALSAYAGPLGQRVAEDSIAHVSDRLRVRVEAHPFTVTSDLDKPSADPDSK